MNNKSFKPVLMMTYFSWSSFVKRDFDLFSNEFQVIKYHFNVKNKFLLPISFLKQFIFIVQNFNNINVIVSQSAGYISFIPSLFKIFFKKPLVIIAIGTDCVSFPEFNYGAFNKPILKSFTSFSYKNANLILPVHKSLVFQKYTYDSIKNINQGITAFVKNLKTPIYSIPNGFDNTFWRITINNREKNSFLTVTTAIDKTGYFLKGIDLILFLANEFPNYKFTIIGKVVLENEKPSNLKLIDHVPHENLLDIYNQHQYYMQLSMSEGFPNSLCEAMLCGCYPIGSNVASIPEIIGSTGKILPKKDKFAIKKVFLDLETNDINKDVIREKILLDYTLEKRGKLLINQISDVIL